MVTKGSTSATSDVTVPAGGVGVTTGSSPAEVAGAGAVVGAAVVVVVGSTLTLVVVVVGSTLTLVVVGDTSATA